MEENSFATLALFSWPLVALAFYYNRPVNQATLWTILWGLLLLPPHLSYKIAMIPPFDKSTIPTYAAFAGCLLFARNGKTKFWQGFGLAEVFILACVFSPVVSAIENPDPIVFTHAFLPGVDWYDGFSSAIAQFMMILPFFLGRKMLRTTADNEEIFRTLVFAGLIYSIPMLFEVRMSPQLNQWIYGYFPGDFAQQVRDEGFRPIVFMGHGLSVAFFMMTAIAAAAVFWRTRTRINKNFSPGAIVAYLSVVLFFCKSTAAMLYAAVSVVLIRFTRPRLQVRIAVAIAILALAYPLLRSAHIVPTRAIIDTVATISTDRADSLTTRFENEDVLIAKAEERFLFGWGRFGRNRIYNYWGKDITLTDSVWAITVGTFGIVGFFAQFGLIALPIFRAASALKSAESERDQTLLAALTLMMGIAMFDMLLNANLNAWVWLLLGALLGRAEALQSVAPQKTAALAPKIQRHGRPLRLSAFARTKDKK